MESILTSIKLLLGIEEDDVNFDTEIIIHINTMFMILNDLGVGPSKCFSIKDKNAVWTDFEPNINEIESVKTYIHLRVKLIFDPPSNASTIKVIEETIDELEWRLKK